MRDLTTEGVRGRRMAEFWASLGEGAVGLQRCASCGWMRFPPSATCPDCGHEAADWVSLGDRGTLRSWTVTHPAAEDRLPKRMRAEIPYVLGLVEMEQLPGYLLPVRVVTESAEVLNVGDPVWVGLADDEPRRLIAKAVAT